LKPIYLQLLADNRVEEALAQDEEDTPDLEWMFQAGYESDPFPAKVLEILEKGAPPSKEITLVK